MVLFSYQYQMATVNESEMLALDGIFVSFPIEKKNWGKLHSNLQILHQHNNQVVSCIAKTDRLYVYLIYLPLIRKAFYAKYSQNHCSDLEILNHLLNRNFLIIIYTGRNVYIKYCVKFSYVKKFKSFLTSMQYLLGLRN